MTDLIRHLNREAFEVEESIDKIIHNVATIQFDKHLESHKMGYAFDKFNLELFELLCLNFITSDSQ
jgi:hypothetical protein